MCACRTPPLSSRGSCKPTDKYHYCTEGAMQLGRRGHTGLVASSWPTPKIMGATCQSLAVVNVCVCVCVCGVLWCVWCVYHCCTVYSTELRFAALMRPNKAETISWLHRALHLYISKLGDCLQLLASLFVYICCRYEVGSIVGVYSIICTYDCAS